MHEPDGKEDVHIFFNISTVKNSMNGTNMTKPHQRIMVDERIPKKFSDF